MRRATVTSVSVRGRKCAQCWPCQGHGDAPLHWLQHLDVMFAAANSDNGYNPQTFLDTIKNYQHSEHIILYSALTGLVQYIMCLRADNSL